MFINDDMVVACEWEGMKSLYGHFIQDHVMPPCLGSINAGAGQFEGLAGSDVLYARYSSSGDDRFSICAQSSSSPLMVGAAFLHPGLMILASHVWIRRHAGHRDTSVILRISPSVKARSFEKAYA
jgi:hypothetical protein